MRHSSAVICLALTLLTGTTLSALQIDLRRGSGPQIKQILITGPVQGGTATTGIIELTAPAQPAPGQLSVPVTLTSSHPAVAIVPASILFKPRATSQSFEVKTNPVPATTQVSITGRVSILPVSANLVVNAPVLESLECTPAELPPASTLSCKACLNGPPASGAAVEFTSTPTTALTPPAASVQVNLFYRCATWGPAGAAIPLSLTTTVQAVYGGITKTAQTKVLARALASFSNLGEVTGGTAVTGKIVLTAPAPEGLFVNLSATPPLTVPSRVSANAGQNTLLFQIATSPVTQYTYTVVTASTDFFGHLESMAAELRIQPARLTSIEIDPAALVNVPLGGRDVAATLRLSAGGGGMKVGLSSSNPRQATVPAEISIEGNVQQGPFTIHVLPCPTASCTVSITAVGPGLAAFGGTNQVMKDLSLTRQ